MSSASDQMIERLRQERVTQAVSSTDPYSKLQVFPKLRRKFFLLMLLAFAAFLFLVAHDLHSAKPWWTLGFPIGGIGLVLSLFPKTEIWQYRPWQNQTRRYERHQVER